MPSITAEDIAAKIRDNAAWFWGGGVLFIVMGVLAILVPHAATLAVELLVGALLAVGGVFELIRAARMRGAGRVVGSLLFGVLALAAGVILLVFPLEGAITLTILLTVFFLAAGVFKTVAAFDARPARGWGWLLANGVLSLLIGVLILIGLPEAGLWVLGLLLGIDFLFFGATLIALILAARQVPQAGGLTE